MTTRKTNEINQNIGRLDRIKHKMEPPRDDDTHAMRDRAWLVSEVERLRAFIQDEYDSYVDGHPNAAGLREEFPWLVDEAAEAAGVKRE